MSLSPSSLPSVQAAFLVSSGHPIPMMHTISRLFGMFSHFLISGDEIYKFHGHSLYIILLQRVNIMLTYQKVSYPLKIH